MASFILESCFPFFWLSQGLLLTRSYTSYENHVAVLFEVIAFELDASQFIKNKAVSEHSGGMNPELAMLKHMAHLYSVSIGQKKRVH